VATFSPHASDPNKEPWAMTNEQNSATTSEERPAQKVSVEDAGPARKLLTIEIPESRIKEQVEKTYQQLSDDAVIPGFRRGRAPRRLLEKRFATGIRSDVKGQLIGECYSQAIEDEKLEVLGEPVVKDIETLEIPESGPLTIKVEVEVSPEVQLPAFDSLQVTKTKRQVTDSDADSEIERLRERMGKLVETTDGEIEDGDFVQADVRVLAGENAGDDAEELAHQPLAYVLVHGEEHEFKGHVLGILVNDLGNRLLGKKPGHEETISMTGPAGHEDEKIKGQPITIKLKLSKIERLEPAAVEQVLAQFGVESQEQMKEQIKRMLEQRNEQQQQADLHQQLNEQLLEKVQLELPEGLTGRQTARVLRRKAMELAYRGQGQDEIEQQIAEMRAGSEEQARRDLKLFFIVDKAAKTLNVEVSEAEINGRIAMMAMQQGRRPEKLRQDMHRRGELENLYLQLREQKTLDQILAQAKVNEVEAAAEEKPKKKSAAKTSKKKADKAAE
jgi:trigger factor